MQNEKAVQGGAPKQGKTNGPVQTSDALTRKDVATTTPAPPQVEGEAATEKPKRKIQKIPHVQLTQLFKDYDAIDVKYQEAVKALTALKVERSKVVEEIFYGSENHSYSFKDREGIWTIMSREDKKEGSPTKGQRLFFFRRPSTYDPLEI